MLVHMSDVSHMLLYFPAISRHLHMEGIMLLLFFVQSSYAFRFFYIRNQDIGWAACELWGWRRQMVRAHKTNFYQKFFEPGRPSGDAPPERQGSTLTTPDTRPLSHMHEGIVQHYIRLAKRHKLGASPQQGEALQLGLKVTHAKKWRGQ